MPLFKSILSRDIRNILNIIYMLFSFWNERPYLIKGLNLMIPTFFVDFAAENRRFQGLWVRLNCQNLQNHSFWPKTMVFEVVGGLNWQNPRFFAEKCTKNYGFWCGFQIVGGAKVKNQFSAKNCSFWP